MDTRENHLVSYVTETDVPVPAPRPITAGLDLSRGNGSYPTGGLTEALSNLEGYENVANLGALMLDGQEPGPTFN